MRNILRKIKIKKIAKKLLKLNPYFKKNKVEKILEDQEIMNKIEMLLSELERISIMQSYFNYENLESINRIYEEHSN